MTHFTQEELKDSNILVFRKTGSLSTFLWDMATIGALLALVYFFKLGSYPLFTPDEGRYSEVAREMIATGDFITPRLNGVVFLDKPILYYWLQASAMMAFGIKEWALRFWPIVSGLWGCLAVYVGGRIVFNRRTGILAATILGTSVLYFGAAHYANLDLEVAVLVSSTLLAFLLGLKTEETALSRRWIYTAYAFAGLAVLTKGLIGIAFPAIIVGSWVFLLRQWDAFKKLRLFTGPLLTLAIVLPWYLLAQNANPEFFHFFFIVQQVSRFLSTNDFNNQVAVWFYAPIVIAGFLPWTLFLPGMMVRNIRNLISNLKQHDATLYFMIWAIFIFTFFSIPHSKTIGYILPVFPALALLTAHYIDQNWNLFFTSKRFTLFFMPLSFALFAIAAWVAPSLSFLPMPEDLIPYLRLAAISLSISAVVLFYFFKRKNFAGLLSASVLSIVAFFFILVNSAAIINENTTKPLALELRTMLKPQDEVATYYKYFQDLPMYIQKRITIVADWEDPNIEHNDNWLRELWYGKSFQDTRDWLINEKTFWQRWSSNKRVFVLTNLKYLEQFKAKAKDRFYLLSQSNETVLITNIKETHETES